jgi:hypothetical protein
MIPLAHPKVETMIAAAMIWTAEGPNILETTAVATRSSGAF